MKMIPGTGTVLDYGLYISNCQTQQRKYKIPVQGLLDVQLYIDFGPDDPGDTADINLVYTCGALAGTTVALTPVKYVIGQDPDDNFYGVFQGFNESIEAASFVIAIGFGDVTYFSEEYEIDTGCNVTPLKLVKGCYGNLEPEISFDAEGIYFGQSQGGTLGDASTVYEHKFLMRDVEVNINGIKNDFKQGKTRTFRTESTKLFLFWGEFIPGWYLEHVDGVFRRGEVYIGTPDEDNPQKWLLDSTVYENLDDCTQCWRPAVLLKKNTDNSFSCEEDPCVVVVDEGGGGEEPDTCCNPSINEATVEFLEGNTVCIDFNPCSPTPANGYVILYRVAGSGGSFSTITGVTSSPFCFGAGGEDGDQFEGFIYSDCGGGITGSQIPWSTGTPSTIQIARSVCTGIFSQYEVTGGNPGDVVVIRATFSGFMTRNPIYNFVRADLTLNAPDGSPTSDIVSSPCYTDTSGHGFGPLVLETTVILGGSGSTTVTTLAVVNNSTPGAASLSVGIVEVNGDAKDIWAIGCAGNSATGGVC
jgi:hypothetical protein